MRSNRQGSSFVTVLLILAAVLIAAYFASDVFRTKANTTYRGFAEWTPENIVKDTVNYLNFCEEQASQSIMKLKASDVAIAQKRAQIESMSEDARNKIKIGSEALTELKSAYRQAETAGQWPVTWRGTSLDQEQCKRQVLKLAGEVKSKSDMTAIFAKASTQLAAQAGKVSETRAKAEEQLAKIQASREVLKVQQITDELKNNLVAMKGVLENSVVGVASAESTSVSLDDLAASAETSVDESQFSEIMKQ